MLRSFCRSHKNADHYIQSLTKKRFYCNKNVEAAAKPASKAAEQPEPSIHRRMYQVSNFDKRILVWVGRYKTTEEIPKTVPGETLDKAKNKARIKFSNYMIVGTIIGCVIMAWSGKRAAQRGESVHKMNLDWHQAIKEGKA